MPTISLNTTIEAPVKRCFDLSGSIDLHKISTQKTNEEAIHPNHTLMTDELHFQAPLGILGKIAESVVLKTYLLRFLAIRNQVIKDFAESEKWKLIPGMEDTYEQ